MTDPIRTYVVSESRAEAATGLALTVMSLCRWTSHTSRIEASLGPDLHHLGDWLAHHDPRIGVRREDGEYSGSWNVKPAHLLRVLDAGADEAVWVDSDVVVTGGIDELLDRHCGSLVATEDVWFAKTPSEEPRHTGWGWRRGHRSLGSVVNSGLVKVEESHVPLLEDWQRSLADPGYLSAQALDYETRPPHFVGDQDALTALLESDRHDGLRLVQLRRGTEVSQAYRTFGATPRERWLSRGRFPVIIHAMGPKPWQVPVTASRSQRREQGRHPYTLAARAYRGDLGELGTWIPGHDSAAPERPMYVGILASAISALPIALRRSGGRVLRRTIRMRGGAARH